MILACRRSANVTTITHEANLNNKSARNHLPALIEDGLVKEKNGMYKATQKGRDLLKAQGVRIPKGIKYRIKHGKKRSHTVICWVALDSCRGGAAISTVVSRTGSNFDQARKILDLLIGKGYIESQGLLYVTTLPGLEFMGHMKIVIDGLYT